MPGDRIKKTKIFERNFECQIMGKKNSIRSESVLNQNTVKVYIDGSKLNERIGAGFYAEYPNNSPKQAVFLPSNMQHCVSGRRLFQKWQRTCFWKKMHNQSIVVLLDS